MTAIRADRTCLRLPRRIADFIAAKVPRLIQREPDLTVPGRDGPYLNRWHLIPRNRILNLYLHQFLASDEDRALHDHPWASLSMILSGRYIEHTIRAGGIHTAAARKTGDLIFRLPRQAHRIEMPDDVPCCWTLFLTGPCVRKWGFHTPSGWVHWKEFKQKPREPQAVPLSALEAAALDALLQREIMDTCSNEKAGVYEAIRSKLASERAHRGPAGEPAAGIEPYAHAFPEGAHCGGSNPDTVPFRPVQ